MLIKGVRAPVFVTVGPLLHVMGGTVTHQEADFAICTCAVLLCTQRPVRQNFGLIFITA